MIFNYMMNEGAFIFDGTAGCFHVNEGKMKSAVKKLTGEIMTIQAEGSYVKARAMLSFSADRLRLLTCATSLQP